MARYHWPGQQLHGHLLSCPAEVQLKPKHQPYKLGRQWPELLLRFTDASDDDVAMGQCWRGRASEGTLGEGGLGGVVSDTLYARCLVSNPHSGGLSPWRRVRLGAGVWAVQGRAGWGCLKQGDQKVTLAPLSR